MNKISLALLVVGTTATRIAQEDDCWGKWIWEDCSSLWYHSDWCKDDCGWWYSPDKVDAWWVTCDEWEAIESSCEEWNHGYWLAWTVMPRATRPPAARLSRSSSRSAWVSLLTSFSIFISSSALNPVTFFHALPLTFQSHCWLSLHFRWPPCSITCAAHVFHFALYNRQAGFNYFNMCFFSAFHAHLKQICSEALAHSHLSLIIREK